MRFVHLVADWKWTGPAAPGAELAAAEARAGGRVTLLCGRPPAGARGSHLAERAAALGLSDVRTFRLGSKATAWRNLSLARALRALARGERIAAVHVHGSVDHALALWALRGLRDRPRLVRSNRRAEPLAARRGERFLGARCDGILECSARAAEEDRRAFSPIAARIRHAFGGVDLHRFRPGKAPETRGAWGVRDTEVLFGVVARIQARRRFDVLLEAFRRVRGEAPGARLAILGRGTRAREVAVEPARRMGLDEAVLFPGYVGDGYERALRALDAGIFLLPGTDGSCRAAREMMATGLPVAALGGGIVPEILPQGGGAVCGEDAASLAAALLDLARDPAARRRRSAAARAFAEREFRWDAVVRTAAALYGGDQ